MTAFTLLRFNTAKIAEAWPVILMGKEKQLETAVKDWWVVYDIYIVTMFVARILKCVFFGSISFDVPLIVLSS